MYTGLMYKNITELSVSRRAAFYGVVYIHGITVMNDVEIDDLNITGYLNVTGDLTLDGSLRATDGTINVADNTLFANDIYFDGGHVNGKLYGHGGSLTIGDVTYFEDNVHIDGVLYGVGGILTIGDDLECDHDLGVSGTSRLDGVISATSGTNSFGGDVSIVGDLSAAATQISSLINTGTSRLDGVISATSGTNSFGGAVSIAGSLSAGATQISSLINTGASRLDGAISATSGTNSFGGAVSITGSLSAAATQISSLINTGTSRLDGAISATSGTNSFSGDVSIAGDVSSVTNVLCTNVVASNTVEVYNGGEVCYMQKDTFGMHDATYIYHHLDQSIGKIMYDPTYSRYMIKADPSDGGGTVRFPRVVIDTTGGTAGLLYVQGTTTTSTVYPTLIMSGSGRVYMLSCSIDTKRNILPIVNMRTDEVFELEPHIFEDATEIDEDDAERPKQLGYIAEDIKNPYLTMRDADGKIIGINEPAMRTITMENVKRLYRGMRYMANMLDAISRHVDLAGEDAPFNATAYVDTLFDATFEYADIVVDETRKRNPFNPLKRQAILGGPIKRARY